MMVADEMSQMLPVCAAPGLAASTEANKAPLMSVRKIVLGVAI